MRKRRTREQDENEEDNSDKIKGKNKEVKEEVAPYSVLIGGLCGVVKEQQWLPGQLSPCSAPASPLS